LKELLMSASLLAQYLESEAQMDELRDGEQLRRAARAVIKRLGSGRLTLVSTSAQGAGLIAACAALRSEPTSWREVNLMLAPEFGDEELVFVEPIDAGEAWRSFVRARYPHARFAFADEAPALRVA
jgi:hypothetical protein